MALNAAAFLFFLTSLPSSAVSDAQGQPVYMTAGPGGMAVQGQAVDANGMVRTYTIHTPHSNALNGTELN